MTARRQFNNASKNHARNLHSDNVSSQRSTGKGRERQRRRTNPRASFLNRAMRVCKLMSERVQIVWCECSVDVDF